MSHTTQPIVLELAHVGKLPIFTTTSFHDAPLERIFGYTETARCEAVFPAFPPAVWSVLNDINAVFKDDVTFGPAAQAHIAKLQQHKALYEQNSLPVKMNYVFKPFEHQHRALCHAYYNYRSCLGLEMGLGKSKVIIDLLRMLKVLGEPYKALVLVPPHLVNNWVEQIRTHTHPGELSVLAFADRNNNVLDVETRTSMYSGVFTTDVNPAWRYAAEFPDLYYEPIPDGLPQECYDIERQFIEAIVSGDSIERGKLGAQLNRRAKKYDFVRPSGSWRVLPARVTAADVDVLIMAYDIAVSDLKIIEQHVAYDVLIMDESHYLRSISSNRSKGVVKLGRRAARMVFSSGSPSAGDPQHVYRMLEMICSAYIGDYLKFQRRYVIKPMRGFGVVGFKNLHILNEIMGECALMMGADDCVGLDLPPLNIVDIPVPIDDHTKSLYNQLVDGHKAWIPEHNALLETQYAAERITKLLQTLSGFVIDGGKDSTICDGCVNLMHCVSEEIKPYSKKCVVQSTPPKRELLRLRNQPKLTLATGLIEDILLQENSKVIVWCQFTAELQMLAEVFDTRRWDYARVDGGTTNAEDARRRFDTDPKCRIYLSNVAISDGFTINAANYTLYYGLTYNLVHYLQSMKRNHRIGQEQPVTVYRLYTPGTVHDAIRRALDLKEDISNTLCDVIRCSHCPHFTTCTAAGVSPFDPACIYSKKVSRPTTKAELI